MTRIREMRVQIDVRWICLKRTAALIDRLVDGRQVLLQHADGFRIQFRTLNIERPLKVGDRLIVVPIGEVCRDSRWIGSNLCAHRLKVGMRVPGSRHPDQSTRQHHQRQPGGRKLWKREREARSNSAAKWGDEPAKWSSRF